MLIGGVSPTGVWTPVTVSLSFQSAIAIPSLPSAMLCLSAQIENWELTYGASEESYTIYYVTTDEGRHILKRAFPIWQKVHGELSVRLGAGRSDEIMKAFKTLRSAIR